MTTSGTYSFAPQVDDLLTEAWERLGLSGAVLTGDTARSARRSLQYMLLDWTNRDLRLWQIERWNTALVPGTQIMTAPPASVDILEMIVTVGGNDLVLTPLSRDEWIAIPNKTLSTRPTSFWVERRLDVPVIHIWPVPDQAYPLAITRLRVPADVNAMTQTVDAPTLWLEAVVAGLAARMAEKFAPDREDKMLLKAERAYENAARETRERVPLTILPRIDW